MHGLEGINALGPLASADDEQACGHGVQSSSMANLHYKIMLNATCRGVWLQHDPDISYQILTVALGLVNVIGGFDSLRYYCDMLCNIIQMCA